MTAFTLHSIQTAPIEAKEELAAVELDWNFIPNVHRSLAESPMALAAYNSLFELLDDSSFTRSEQQVACLAIAVLHESEYGTALHSALARSCRVPDDAIEALREQRPIDDQRLEALRLFAETLVRRQGIVGEPAVQAFLNAGFSRGQVLELVTIIAIKTICDFTSHIAATPLDAFMSETRWVAPRNRLGRAS